MTNVFEYVEDEDEENDEEEEEEQQELIINVPDIATASSEEICEFIHFCRSQNPPLSNYQNIAKALGINRQKLFHWIHNPANGYEDDVQAQLIYIY